MPEKRSQSARRSVPATSLARRRLAFNGLRAGLIFLSFAYFFTGKTAHEWVGLVAVVALFAHGARYFRRWKKPFAGTPRVNFRKIAVFAVNFALAVALVAVAVSGAMLSDVIFPFIPGGDGLTARKIHTTAAAWLFVLSALHLGFHAKLMSASLKNAFGVRGNGGRRGRREGFFRFVVPAAFAGISACGIFAFVRRQFAEKLAGESTFDAFALADSLPRFLCDYGSVAVLFFFAGWLIEKFLFLRRPPPRERKRATDARASRPRSGGKARASEGSRSRVSAKFPATTRPRFLPCARGLRRCRSRSAL